MFRLLSAGLLIVLLQVAGPGWAAETLLPLGQPDTVPIGRSAKTYLVLDSDTLVFPVLGPGTITIYSRVPLGGPEAAPRKGTLKVLSPASAAAQHPLEFEVTRSSKYGDSRSGVPSGGRKTVLEIGPGEQRLELGGLVVGGGPMYVIVYYDGPAQPTVKGLMRIAQPEPKKKKKSPWTFRGNAGIDVIDNDNVLTNSPDYMDDFITGSYPWKFIHKTNDDLVIAPSFDIETRNNDFLSWGQTRLKFKVKRWMYANNPIKTNTDFHFYLRQYFGKNQSLEGYFHFAPEQYIRQLSDRRPDVPGSTPINWTEFRFQRNVWNLTWRQRISRSLTAKFLYEENYRYYNQPFMENDITAWEVRGNVAWRINRVYTLNLDYSFEDGNGRGLDEVGENILDSDNSDPSYERDLYRIGLTVRHKGLKKFIDRFDVSFLFMDYYYTTLKSLVDDPYHAGRRDTYYKATLELRRKLSKNITAKTAVRRTQRVVYSPWEGDITTDKDFTQWLYWVNLNYRF